MDPIQYLLAFKCEIGYDYYCYQPTTPTDRVVPEDIGVTLLINSGAVGASFRTLMRKADLIDLATLPDTDLLAATTDQIKHVAAQLAAWTALEQFSASSLTKLLHKKRPRLIPVLDNLAIFGAYLNPEWPGKPAPALSIKAMPPPKYVVKKQLKTAAHRIFEALATIHDDLARHESGSAWQQLHMAEPERSAIELFDMVWWYYFRSIEPPPGSKAAKDVAANLKAGREQAIIGGYMEAPTSTS